MEEKDTTKATQMRNRHFDLVYLKMAKEWSQMSYAEKLKVGCLIVKDRAIIADGFNGAPSGFPNVCEGLDGHTLPETLHAEANAITKLARSTNSSNDATLYCTAAPCLGCAKLIVQSGIIRVVYLEAWKHIDGLELLKKAGVKVEHIKKIF